MINGSPGSSERTSANLLPSGNSGIRRDRIHGVVERYETLDLRIEYLAGVDLAGVVQDLQDPFRIGYLLGPEVQNGRYDVSAVESGIAPDELIQTDGERFHDRRPPLKCVPRLLPIDSLLHPVFPTVRRAAERTAPKETTFERDIASCTMKPNPTETVEMR